MADFPALNSTNCLCVVVTFNPDKALRVRLKKLIELFQFVLIVDNSCESEQIKKVVAYTKGLDLVLIKNTKNLGLGRALNQGFEYALANDFYWCVFFDQDTEVYPLFLSSLQDSLDSQGYRPAIIGSNYIDDHAHKPRFKEGLKEKSKYRKVKTVITSGSLISTRLYSEIGGFREDYFIDSIDHEYCLRARKFNHEIVLNTKISMKHSLGEKRVGKGAITSIPEHVPIRKYYIARNTIVTISTYWSHEKAWCLKQIFRLFIELFSVILFESNKRVKLEAILKGVIYGLKGRMDAYS
ncbi:MAG: glycosyltransferase [Pseudomonadales bacterium]|nr:glycosyltransferase [Pseudomonadales bacterium]